MARGVCGRLTETIAAAVAVALLASAAPASAAVVYDQYDSPAGGGNSSATAPDTRTADDFVVPPGQAWLIGGVDVLETRVLGAMPTSFNVDFYGNAADLPGATTASRPGSSYTRTMTDLSIAIDPAVSLTPGTYWVSVQANTTGDWFWNNRTLTARVGAAFENPNNSTGTGCTTWARRMPCFPDIPGPDQVFRLNGSAASLQTLTVTKSGSGSGSVTSSPAGIDCGTTCAARFAHGTSVALTATAATGSTFVGWSGACSGTGSCAVMMNADHDVTAEFNLARPNTRITKAKITQAKQKATFRFKAIGPNSTFQCKLTGQTKKLKRFRKCSSPKTYKHLKAGKHVFFVRASGTAGPDPTPARKRFRIRS